MCGKHWNVPDGDIPYGKAPEENQVCWAAEWVNFLLWLWIASSPFMSDMVTY